MGTWSNWEPLGGTIISAPGAVSRDRNIIDVFALGQDSAVWQKRFDGSWHDWESLGGVLTSAPTASSWDFGRLDVFHRGADSQLWHKFFERS